MEPAKKLATYDDLLALPEDVKAEVIHGVVVQPPGALPRHSSVQGKLRSFIGRPFDDDDGRGGPGGWWLLLEVDVRLSAHDVVRPDLAGWRRDRLPDPHPWGAPPPQTPEDVARSAALHEAPWDVRPIDVVPDWICEVTSPSNAGMDRVTKRQLYAEAGVAHYWIADPAAGTIETYRLRDLRERVTCDSQGLDATKRWVDSGAFDASARARIPPFEEVELELGRGFPPPPKDVR